MSQDLVAKIAAATKHASSAYHRLVLVVGPARSGKTAALQEIADREGWARVNVNLSLSELLLELTHRQRALRSSQLMSEIIDSIGGGTVILDNLEILFGADLQLDPLRLLYGLSRNRTIVAAWPGTVDGQTLVYGEPGHPEYRRETKVEALLVPSAETHEAAEAEAAHAKR